MVYMMRAMCLLILGVEGKVELRAAVGSLLVGVGGVAVVAMHAQIAGPSVHDVADLFAGQILGQHFQIGGCGKGAGRTAAFWEAALVEPGQPKLAAKTATARRATVAEGRNREEVFKRRFLAGWDGVVPMDGILLKNDALAD